LLVLGVGVTPQRARLDPCPTAHRGESMPEPGCVHTGGTAPSLYSVAAAR
jgi:hypothetical protein